MSIQKKWNYSGHLAPFSSQFWDISDTYHCAGLRCTVWWFHTHINCKIITIRLVNTSFTSHNYYFVVVMVKLFKIYSVSNFQVYSTVLLTIAITLYIRAPELIHLITRSLYPLSNISCMSPTPQPLTTTILLCSCELGFFRFHMSVRSYSICLFLTYFTDLAPWLGSRIIFPRTIA